jgi:hypothetical protein
MFLHTNGHVFLLAQALLYVSSYKRARFFLVSSAFVFQLIAKRLCVRLKADKPRSLMNTYKT